MDNRVLRVVAAGFGVALAAVLGLGSAAQAADPPPSVGEGSALFFEPPAGVVGQELQLFGLGFPADTDISASTTASPDPVLLGKTAEDGTFQVPYTVPHLDPGQHPVDVTAGSHEGTVQLLVLPPDGEPAPGADQFGCFIAPDTVSVGQEVVIETSGLPIDARVFLSVDSDPQVNVALGPTREPDHQAFPWIVPDIAPGQYGVSMSGFGGGGFAECETTLTVTAATAPSPEPSPSDSAPVVPVPAAATQTATPTPQAAPPELASSGAPDALPLLPWGLAALTAGLMVRNARVRRRPRA